LRLPLHGANPLQLYHSLGKTPPSLIMDYSVNTNPFMNVDMAEEISKEALLKAVTDYPDPYCTALVHKLSNENELNREKILVTNGGIEAVYLLAQYLQGKRIGIIEPTFNEYRRACATYGCTIERYAVHEENGWKPDEDTVYSFIASVNAVFLCNPNNPTGTVIERPVLLKMLGAAKQSDTLFIVDEAFYDFCMEDISVLPLLYDYSNLVILRSLTKMHNLAGVRLGYVAANEQIIQQLQSLQPTWSVNGVAQLLGLYCLEQTDYVEMTKRYIDEERKRIFELLKGLEFVYSPSQTNFYLLRHSEKSTDELFHHLLGHGIVSRHTNNFAGLDGNYVRMAVKLRAENDYVLQLLEDWAVKC
jgi:threonine-phosphate decarboxylase